MDLDDHKQSPPFTCFIRKNNRSGVINIPYEILESFGLAHDDLVTVVFYKKVGGKSNGGDRNP